MNRSTETLLLIALTAPWLLSMGSCKKEKAPAHPATGVEAFAVADTTPLWKLIPKDAALAIVVADGALGHVHRGAGTLVESIQVTEQGRQAIADMRKNAAGLALALEAKTPTDYGWDLSKGAAFFAPPGALDKDTFVMLLPVSDPETFARKTDGKKDGDRYVWKDEMNCRVIANPGLVCSKDAARTMVASDGGMAAPPADYRGHVEVHVSKELVSKFASEGPIKDATEFRGAAVLERGGITLHGTFFAQVESILKTSGASALLADIDEQKPSGFFSMRASSGWQALKMMVPVDAVGQVPLGGVTIKQLFNSLQGDFAILIASGEKPGGEFRAQLTSSDAFAKLVDGCEQLVPLPFVQATKTADRCHLVINLPKDGQKNAPTIPEIRLDFWTQDHVFHIGVQDYDQKPSPGYLVAKSGRAFADGAWAFTTWGHGGPLNVDFAEIAAAIPEFAAAIQKPAAQLGLWALFHFSEMGFATRADDSGVHFRARLSTTWSNPDAVLKELEPLIERMSDGEFAARQEVASLATKHPQSTLARDLHAGVGGAAPSFLIGALAAVAIPAFMKYVKKSKTSEARVMVRKMSDGVQAFYATTKTLPKLSTAITPPLRACCTNGNQRCQPDLALWTHPSWTAIHFSIDDPHYYSYQYEISADGKKFTARAIGDLDCDGIYSTFESAGEISGGELKLNKGLYRERELE